MTRAAGRALVAGMCVAAIADIVVQRLAAMELPPEAQREVARLRRLTGRL